MAHVAVVLSGCGFMDGSEIHESVLCLLALAQAGHRTQCFAPNIKQAKVVNHLSGKEEVGVQRNVLQEAARIARGHIKPLDELRVDDFDAILLPGGFGAALNLCTFATEEEHCHVDPTLRQALENFHRQGKAIGATCIAPVILAKTFEGKDKIKMTLGSNPGALDKLSKMGMEPQAASTRDCIIDEKNKIYTTPCYMEPDDLAGMFEGIKKVVAQLG